MSDKKYAGKRTFYRELQYSTYLTAESNDEKEHPVGRLAYDYDTCTFEFIDNGAGVVATVKLWSETDFWFELCGRTMDEAIRTYIELTCKKDPIGSNWAHQGSRFATSVQNFLKAGCDPREATQKWRDELGTKKVPEEAVT